MLARGYGVGTAVNQKVQWTERDSCVAFDVQFFGVRAQRVVTRNVVFGLTGGRG